MNTADPIAEAEALGAGFDMIRGQWVWVWRHHTSLDHGATYPTKRESATAFLRSRAALEARYGTAHRTP